MLKIKLTVIAFIGLSCSTVFGQKMPSEKEYYEMIEKTKQCLKNRPGDIDCVKTANKSLINVELYTVCSIDEKADPACKNILPKNMKKDIELLKTCLANPDNADCSKLPLPAGWKKDFKSFEAPITMQDTFDMYREADLKVRSCVTGKNKPVRKYITAECVEIIPPDLMTRILLRDGELKENPYKRGSSGYYIFEGAKEIQKQRNKD